MTKERRRELKTLAQSLIAVGVSIDDCIGLDECIDKAFEADCYRWHDLWKDPNDLPETNLQLCLTAIEIKGFVRYEVRSEWGVKHDKSCGVRSIIAWKYIEPFEGDVEWPWR